MVSVTKKARDLKVGDVWLVATVPIGSMSLTTGKFKRATSGGYDEERLIVAVEHGFEDGWPPTVPGEKFDPGSWGPQPTVFVTCEGKEYASQFEPDDDVRVKVPYA